MALLEVITTLPAAGYLLALVIVGFAVERFLVYYRLRHFKGPPLGYISFLWLFNAMRSQELHLKLAEVCDEYGPVARIGSNDLITTDIDILRRMSSAKSGYRRSRWYEVAKLNPHLHNVATEPNEERHMKLRNKMLAGYSGKDIVDFEGTVDKHVLELIDLINRKYISDGADVRPFDMARKVQYFTLDTITDIAFGEPFGDVPADGDVHSYIEMTEGMFPVLFLIQGIPGAIWLLQSMQKIPWISDLIMPTYADKSGFGALMGLANRVVAERYGPNKKTRKDQLGSFIQHGLTQEEAETETLLQITAGSDTTASGIRAILLYVITQPHAYTKLQSEISQAERRNSILKPVIRIAEARTLPYLQACIKEGLRLLPPVPGTMPKTVPPGGDVINGKFVPEGTDIGVCAWGLYRNPRIFGEDADCFRPERWLEASPEQLLRMEQTVDFIFGHGKWGCLGKNLAMMEINKVLVEVRIGDPQGSAA